MTYSKNKPPPAWIPHGYAGYCYYGCRCEACKAAKAAYMREHRAAKRSLVANPVRPDGARYVADLPPGASHGLYGYQEYSCRCGVCTAAKAKASTRQWKANR